MRWAGRKANVDLPLLPALMIVNQDFAHPLPLSVGAGDGTINREVPQAVGRPWLALSPVDRSAGGALGKTDRQSQEAKRITQRQQ